MTGSPAAERYFNGSISQQAFMKSTMCLSNKGRDKKKKSASQ